MPPNRFESEVESFLEGSHGDRTHIKRADHPRLHHYAGRYSVRMTTFATTGAKKFAQRDPSSGVFAKKLAQHATKRQFWVIIRTQGELFRAHTHHQTEQGELFRAQAAVTWRR